MTYIEIRCGGDPNSGCYDCSNNNPQILLIDTNEAILRGMKWIREEARDKGWRRVKGHMMCPVCYKNSLTLI